MAGLMSTTMVTLMAKQSEESYGDEAELVWSSVRVLDVVLPESNSFRLHH